MNTKTIEPNIVYVKDNGVKKFILWFSAIVLSTIAIFFAFSFFIGLNAGLTGEPLPELYLTELDAWASETTGFSLTSKEMSQ